MLGELVLPGLLIVCSGVTGFMLVSLPSSYTKNGEWSSDPVKVSNRFQYFIRFLELLWELIFEALRWIGTKASRYC
jgi:hypothetical protein